MRATSNPYAPQRPEADKPMPQFATSKCTRGTGANFLSMLRWGYTSGDDMEQAETKQLFQTEAIIVLIQALMKDQTSAFI